jgi:hypothetical protein
MKTADNIYFFPERDDGLPFHAAAAACFSLDAAATR